VNSTVATSGSNAAVTTADIANAAVTTSKLANAAVTSSKLANGAVTSSKLANNAVTATRLAPGSVHQQHLAADVNTSISAMIDTAIASHAASSPPAAAPAPASPSPASPSLTTPDHYIGQIALVGFNFAPRGWALCQGQLLSISQNTALFSLLGTTYGGDGRSTFALPDLRNQRPVSGGLNPSSVNYIIALDGAYPPRQ